MGMAASAWHTGRISRLYGLRSSIQCWRLHAARSRMHRAPAWPPAAATAGWTRWLTRRRRCMPKRSSSIVRTTLHGRPSRNSHQGKLQSGQPLWRLLPSERAAAQGRHGRRRFYQALTDWRPHCLTLRERLNHDISMRAGERVRTAPQKAICGMSQLPQSGGCRGTHRTWSAPRPPQRAA